MPPETKIPNNAEIDQALKEFEAKSGGQPIPQTSGVSRSVEINKSNNVGGIKFDTDSYKSVEFGNELAVPKMVKLIMKLSGGVIKEQKQAEYVLFGLAMLMFLASLYFFFSK
jgi:hypothetical protein